MFSFQLGELTPAQIVEVVKIQRTGILTRDELQSHVDKMVAENKAAQRYDAKNSFRGSKATKMLSAEEVLQRLHQKSDELLCKYGTHPNAVILSRDVVDRLRRYFIVEDIQGESRFLRLYGMRVIETFGKDVVEVALVAE